MYTTFSSEPFYRKRFQKGGLGVSLSSCTLSAFQLQHLKMVQRIGMTLRRVTVPSRPARPRQAVWPPCCTSARSKKSALPRGQASRPRCARRFRGAHVGQPQRAQHDSAAACRARGTSGHLGCVVLCRCARADRQAPPRAAGNFVRVQIVGSQLWCDGYADSRQDGEQSNNVRRVARRLPA